MVNLEFFDHYAYSFLSLRTDSCQNAKSLVKELDRFHADVRTATAFFVWLGTNIGRPIFIEACKERDVAGGRLLGLMIKNWTYQKSSFSLFDTALQKDQEEQATRREMNVCSVVIDWLERKPLSQNEGLGLYVKAYKKAFPDGAVPF
jgi:hypothetical protein